MRAVAGLAVYPGIGNRQPAYNRGMSDIATHLSDIRNRLEAACQSCGRDPNEVGLLAVSKTKPTSMIEQALAAGQQDFGENYLQDALPKITALPTATWHFIGAIQSNKTKDIANHFDWVHSLATEKVARRISGQRDPQRGDLKVLVQVNTSAENRKSGVSPEAALALVKYLAVLPNLQPVGLMTIPAAAENPEAQRKPFQLLREIRDHIRRVASLPEFQHLSMGMTDDFEVAIAEGATWIRIGTAIFGTRS